MGTSCESFLIDRNRSAVDSLGQCLSRHKLQHQVVHIIALFNTMNRGDVGMIQRGKKASFTFESRQSLFVLGENFRENFDSDFTTELGVPGFVHFAHSAGTNGGEDFVLSEFGAGSELRFSCPRGRGV